MHTKEKEIQLKKGEWGGNAPQAVCQGEAHSVVAILLEMSSEFL